MAVTGGDFKPGDRVVFTSGHHRGRMGTIDSIDVRDDIPGEPTMIFYLIFVDGQRHSDGTPLIHVTLTISFEKVSE